MGTSLGGLIAQVLAARHPDRIDRLILSSTWKVNKSPLEVNADVFRTLASYRADTATNAPKIAKFFFPPDCLRDRPELVEIFRGNSRDDGQKARRGAILAQLVEADLASFDRPTLLLAGSEDRLIPNAETFAIARDLKRAETRVIEQVGHVSSIQAPERVAEAAIAFLNVKRRRIITRGEDHGRPGERSAFRRSAGDDALLAIDHAFCRDRRGRLLRFLRGRLSGLGAGAEMAPDLRADLDHADERRHRRHARRAGVGLPRRSLRPQAARRCRRPDLWP